jgi:hypothetical protein
MRIAETTTVIHGGKLLLNRPGKINRKHAAKFAAITGMTMLDLPADAMMSKLLAKKIPVIVKTAEILAVAHWTEIRTAGIPVIEKVGETFAVAHLAEIRTTGIPVTIQTAEILAVGR